MKNSEGRSIGGLLKFGCGLDCNILNEIFTYVLKNISKRYKKKINFDELPKRNSRIKITKIKNMRFGTKVLKCTFKKLN